MPSPESPAKRMITSSSCSTGLAIASMRGIAPGRGRIFTTPSHHPAEPVSGVDRDVLPGHTRDRSSDPDGDARVVDDKAESVSGENRAEIEGGSDVLETPAFGALVLEPRIPLLEALDSQSRRPHVDGRCSSRLAHTESQPARGERVRAGRGLEIDVEATVELEHRRTVDAPTAGPVALEPNFVRGLGRLPDDVRGASHPLLVECELVADPPRLALLDRSRMPVHPVAGALAAEENHLEPGAGTLMAPGRHRRELGRGQAFVARRYATAERDVPSFASKSGLMWATKRSASSGVSAWSIVSPRLGSSGFGATRSRVSQLRSPPQCAPPPCSISAS